MAYTMKQARVGIGYTQQEMADKMGIHVQTYARMEKHPEDMTIKQAKNFSNIVRVPLSELSFASEL